MTHNESDLIKRAQSGDTAALCLLAENHQQRIYALALRFCRNHAEAEDLSQEVWLKAFAAIRSFRGEASFHTWLRHIAVNTFLDHKRRVRHRRESAAGAEFELLEAIDGAGAGVTPTTPEEDIQRKILVDRVTAALAELPARQRLMLLLKHYEGMTYEEIASACGCSVGTVKKSLFRTLTKLRQRLGVAACAEKPYAAGSSCTTNGFY